MKLAVIDVGSNAARLLITEVIENKKQQPVFNKLNLIRVPLRLGFDVFETGFISDQKKTALLETIKAFKHLLNVYQVKGMKVCATSAMRDAGNSASIVKEVFDATGIRAANLSAWLKGKPQVISAARVAALLYHLGVQGGQLRSDMVHTWSDQGEWAHLRTVFNLLQAPVAPRCLFLDEHPGMSHTRFLQWGEAWVRLSLTPGPTAQDDLAAMVSPNRMIVLPVALEGLLV